MSNVLNEEKKQQVIALGKLGWPLRRIEQATGVRRETASAYLKAVGIVVRLPRFWGKRVPAKPANEVTPDPDSKPAKEVTPGFNAAFSPKAAIRSTCEAYRDLIEHGLALGRNSKAIWQDLVSDHGFAGGYHDLKWDASQPTSLVAAIHDQLGLKLVMENRKLNHLVVDSVEEAKTW